MGLLEDWDTGNFFIFKNKKNLDFKINEKVTYERRPCQPNDAFNVMKIQSEHGNIKRFNWKITDEDKRFKEKIRRRNYSLNHKKMKRLSL